MKNLLLNLTFTTLLLSVAYSQCNDSNWEEYYPNMYGCNFSGANLTNANLSNANIRYANFIGADLSGADFSYSDLSHSNLGGTILDNTNFSFASIQNAVINSSDGEFVNFFAAQLQNTYLEWCDFESATMIGAILIDTEMSGIDLTNANLTGSNLFGANLYYSDLSYASFISTNLDNANLDQANLTGALFLNSTLNGTCVEDAESFIQTDYLGTPDFCCISGDSDDDNICDADDNCNGEYDICGVCNGDGILEGTCDCYGNTYDCAGICGGTTIEDCLGICGGDAAVDCIGVCGGNSGNGDCDGNGIIDVCEESLTYLDDFCIEEGDNNVPCGSGLEELEDYYVPYTYESPLVMTPIGVESHYLFYGSFEIQPGSTIRMTYNNYNTFTLEALPNVYVDDIYHQMCCEWGDGSEPWCEDVDCSNPANLTIIGSNGETVIIEQYSSYFDPNLFSNVEYVDLIANSAKVHLNGGIIINNSGADICDDGSCDDEDEDGICDDVDSCVGEYDDCGVCEGGNAAMDCSGECFGGGTDCNEDGIDDVCEDEYELGYVGGYDIGALSGDATGDGVLNVADLVYFIDVILNGN